MIPIIDLSPLNEGDEGYKKVANDFFDVYSSYGFGSIINHSISEQLIDDIFALTEAFHALDPKIKLHYRYQQYLRGFLPANVSTLKTSKLATVTKPNLNESFMILNDVYAGEEAV